MAYDPGYWDDVGETHVRHHLHEDVADYKRREHIDLLKRYCGSLLSASSVLKTDLFEDAFGPDHFYDWLKDNSRMVVGMDISKRICSSALDRNNGGSFVNSSVVDPAFKDGCFNIIVSNSTLDHVKQSELNHALNEFSRMLVKGGLLVLTLDNAHNPLYRIGYAIVKKTNLFGYNQEKCFFKSEVIPLLEDAGFDVVETGSIVHLPTPFNLFARIFSPLNRILLRLPVLMGIRLFSLVGLNGRNIYTGWFLSFKCIKR